ncbi:MAG: hypothetical protein ACKVT1_06190 [Dehalococcoidia bacterium]
MPEPDRWEERLLQTTARSAVFPASPDIVSGVMARLPADPVPRHSSRRVLRPVLAAIAALALATAGLLIGSREARDAVADFLGLAVEGERIELIPPPAPGVTPTPLPAPRPLAEIATLTTKEAVTSRLGFSPAEPPGLGEPLAYYIATYLGVPVVILHYAAFDLWEVDSPIFEKTAFGKTTEALEELEVGGRPAYWLSEPHIVRFLGEDGSVAVGSERTVPGKTLVWRGSRLNYRLETETLTREEALAIAASLP